MRKLIVSMNITLDGFISGVKDELDWHFTCWTDEMADAQCKALKKADTILLGRTTYRSMAAYWPSKQTDLSFPKEDLAFADMMNRYLKIVFSKTLTTTAWNNSTLARAPVSDTITALKQQAGRDMIIFGSGRLVNDLINWGLVDEYQLWVHPVILGAGNHLFKKLRSEIPLKLISTTTFPSGVVLFVYDVPAGDLKRTQ